MTEAMHVKHVKLSGDITIDDILHLRDIVVLGLKEGFFHVVVDFSKAADVQITSIPVLVWVAGKLREYGGDLKLVSVDPRFSHVIDLAGCTDRFDICKTVNAAEKRFK